MSKETPAYYAVIPASVRYDGRLSANAKLLYGEITAFCNKNGHCWAGSKYFADLYKTSVSSVQRWIKELMNAGHISVSYIYTTGTKEIESRIIKIVKKKPDSKNEYTPEQKCDEAGSKMYAGVFKNEYTPEEKDDEVYSKMHTGVFKNARDNIKINITSSSESSSSEIPAIQNKSPEEEDEKKETVKKKDLRTLFFKVDAAFIFDDHFYSRAMQFLETHELPDSYLSWLYEKCKENKPRNLKNYYYKLFFSEQMTRLFKQEAPGKPEAVYEPCPVCGEKVSSDEKNCPYCRFRMSDKNDNQKINAAREIHRKRTAEVEALRKQGTGTAALIKGVSEIKKRYENSA
ncbi:MAG: helix-turn-helix domain-containing protein [Spirochaetaceae bacterium]|jgi:rRNA maturation protein Nop10|nr:helix-turn-helix domain-containing protein [Spirochaetaceae bacterium]